MPIVLEIMAHFIMFAMKQVPALDMNASIPGSAHLRQMDAKIPGALEIDASCSIKLGILHAEITNTAMVDRRVR